MTVTTIPEVDYLTLEVGQDKDVEWYMTTGVPISGWTIELTFSDLTQEILFTKLIGDGITVTDAARGVIVVRFNRDDTVDLDPDNYSIAIHRTDSGLYQPLASVLVSLRKI